MPYIYALYDAQKPEHIRYVGLTTQTLPKRLSQHKSHTSKGSTHKENWVKKVHASGGEIGIYCIEECDVDGIGDRERYWIKKLFEDGAQLTNLCEGGEGHLNPSKESRLKLSKAMSGRKQSAEHISKCVKANTGKKRSDAFKAAARARSTGKRHSEETIAKLKARPVLIGKDNPSHGLIRTPIQRERMSVARKALYAANPHLVENLKAFRKGKYLGEDSGRAILTESDVRKAFSLHKQGLSNVAIAKQFGVSKSAIRLIVVGRNWSHLNLIQEN